MPILADVVDPGVRVVVEEDHLLVFADHVFDIIRVHIVYNLQFVLTVLYFLQVDTLFLNQVDHDCLSESRMGWTDEHFFVNELFKLGYFVSMCEDVLIGL